MNVIGSQSLGEVDRIVKIAPMPATAMPVTIARRRGGSARLQASAPKALKKNNEIHSYKRTGRQYNQEREAK